MSREITARIAAAMASTTEPVRRTRRSKPHRTEPSYYAATSTPAQRRVCVEGLPPVECNFFHDCLA